MVDHQTVNGHSSPELLPYEAGSQASGSPSFPSFPTTETVLVNLIPHVGRRISVVSKSDNRYEGILKDVDEKKLTASISRVRFWGTEIRQPEVVLPKPEAYDIVTFRLNELKDIFAHVDKFVEMIQDDMVVECSTAVIPIMWANCDVDAYSEGYDLPDGRDVDFRDSMSAEEWNSIMVNKEEAVKLLQTYQGTRNKISIISKSLIRYEGLLKTLDPNTTQMSLVCVRFLGTEDRPAAKKTEPRQETYPSVKFQLGEARDIKAFVKMCDEMISDKAVIQGESSAGFVTVPRNRVPLPPPPAAPPTQIENVNGKLSLVLPERSPRKGGQSIMLQMPLAPSPVRLSSRSATSAVQALTASSASEVMLLRHRESAVYRTGSSKGSTAELASEETSDDKDFLPRSSESRSALRKPVSTKFGRGRKRKHEAATAEDENETEEAQGETSGDHPETGEEAEQEPDGSSEATPVARSSTGKTRKRRRGLGKNSAPARRGRGAAKPRGVSSSPRTVAPPLALPPAAEMETEHKVENGSNDGSMTSSAARSGGAVPSISIMLPYTGAGKMPCPLADNCLEDYGGAGNVYHMEQHFQRAHKELPGVRFVLQCAHCQATGFDNHIPTLKSHMTREHDHDHHMQTSDDIPVGNEEVLDESHEEQDEQVEESGEEESAPATATA